MKLTLAALILLTSTFSFANMESSDLDRSDIHRTTVTYSGVSPKDGADCYARFTIDDEGRLIDYDVERTEEHPEKTGKHFRYIKGWFTGIHDDITKGNPLPVQKSLFGNSVYKQKGFKLVLRGETLETLESISILDRNYFAGIPVETKRIKCSELELME